MGNPQITGPTRPGPTEALRAVFSGIGRILMAADRSQDQARAARRTSSAQPAQASRFRSLDQTGNVRLLTAEDLDDDSGAGRPAPASAGAPPAPAPAANGTTPPAAANGTTAPAANGTVLPLPSYDTLSLASIRARLRTLDVAQLRILANYEATHAERPEVLGMLERRIEKLETGE
jgi:hypothetical protein